MQFSEEMRLNAPWQALPGLNELLTALGPDGEWIRFVGGCVRDTIAGRTVNDIDCATRWRPEVAVEKARAAGFQVIPTGLKHGTITVLLPGGQPVEVTTLRRDVETNGRHATVEFTTDWQADAARRDFTINALSANPFTGEVHDYFGGLVDLAAGRVRFIGNAIDRIDEDRLRVLRFFRFHQRYGQGRPYSIGLQVCRARANVLSELSAERIASELLKMLEADGAADVFELMLRKEILDWIIPEFNDAQSLRMVEQREHALGISPDPIRRLASLISGKGRAQAIARRLKLSNSARDRLIAAKEGCIGDSSIFDQLAYLVGPQALIDRAMLARDIEPRLLRQIIDTYSAWQPPALPIKGGELIQMGLAAGPVVSQSMRQIESEWLASGFPGRDEVLKIAERVVATNQVPV